jgi:hypothetical protein
MGVLPISADTQDPLRMLRLSRNLDKGMYINPDDETSYTTQYISKMCFSHWEPSRVSERMWSVNINASMSG